MFCQNCGTNNADNANVCSNCGTPLNANRQPQQIFNYASQPIVNVPGKGLGVASMVVGIISLVLFCLWYVAIPCAIIGAALGGTALSKAKAVGMKNGMATAGLTCSCIALGVAVLFWLLAAAGLASIGLL